MAHWNSFRPDLSGDHGVREPRQSKKRKITKKKAERVDSLFGNELTSADDSTTIPDLGQTTTEQRERSAALQVAEANFFNTKNSDFWHRGNLDHLRPYDFPFIRALIQQAPRDTLSPEDTRHKEAIRSNIEVVTREYEEEFLREPLNNERPCVMGDNCQGHKLYHIESEGFTLREFLLPSETEEFKRTGTLPVDGRLCLMCKRTEIARAFINIRADGQGVKENVVLQDYRNIVGLPGEYCVEDCILSSPTTYQGLLDPIVLHMKNAYRLETKNGIRYFKQWRMKYPQPKTSFLMPTPKPL